MKKLPIVLLQTEVKPEENNFYSKVFNLSNSEFYHGCVDTLALLINLAIVFGPGIGYVTQSLKFIHNETSYGFSIGITNLLLFANLLRIFFWIGIRFNIYLLYQSILVITLQFMVIYFFIRYRDSRDLPKKHLNNPHKTDLQNSLIQFKSDYLSFDSFWKWNSLWPYIIYFLIITLFISILSSFIGYKDRLYMNILGTISTGIDAITCFPQIFITYKLKSGNNLSVILFGLWILGDSFKVAYYIATKVPIQFIICGTIQALSDIIVVGQIFYYHQGPYNILRGEFFGNKDEKAKENKEKQNDEEEKILLTNETNGNEFKEKKRPTNGQRETSFEESTVNYNENSSSFEYDTF